MELKYIHTLHGYKPLCLIGEHLLLARKNILYLSTKQGKNLTELFRFPLSFKDALFFSSRWLRRIFRYHIHHAFPLSPTEALVSFQQQIYRLNIQTQSITLDKKHHNHFRPLTISRIAGIKGFEQLVCYGEYGDNPQRHPIHIFGRDSSGRWEVLYTFAAGEIGHVHSIVPDPYRQCVWILTGDYNHAAAIWVAHEHFRKVSCVLRNNQIYRASMGFALPEGLLYATDSHLINNAIRLLHHQKGLWVSRYLYPMVGSCIYATQIGDHFFFSTTVEPGPPHGNKLFDLLDPTIGPGIQGRSCEVVGGNLAQGFRRYLQWHADFLPKRLFQFSTILFPYLPTPLHPFLITYAVGIQQHDDQTEIFQII